MVLASCSFWTQAYTCFDSSQSWHVLRKRKRREVVAGVSCLPVVVSQQLTDWNADRGESHFQLGWKAAKKDSKDIGCPVHSTAMTPRSGSLAPVLQAAPLLAPYIGVCSYFHQSVAHACHHTPLLIFFLSCFLFLFSLHLFVRPSAPPCPNALPEAPAQLHSCPALSSSLPQHIHPRALLALAPTLDKRCWAHPELLFPTSMAANCPQGTGAVPGGREGWLLICRGQLLPAPAPAHRSTSLCITGCGERLQPAKGDLLTETY